MAQEDREQTREELDVSECLAVQTLKNQLVADDPKVANKAANDIIAIRLKQAPGSGGPVLNLNFGGMAAAMRAVKETATPPKVEILEERKE
jgi:hypothetical protein